MAEARLLIVAFASLLFPALAVTGAPSPATQALGGEITYLADAPRITECLTGRSYPIAMEADYLALERAYLRDVKTPGGRLHVTLDGAIEPRAKMEGEGTEPAVVVRRFIHTWPGQTCEQARGTPELTNTFWRLVQLMADPVTAFDDRREPHLLLRPGEPAMYSATVGCNTLGGGYVVAGDTLRLNPGVSTLLGCPAPLESLERDLTATLAQVRHWRVLAGTLEFYDAERRPLALFEAVYF